MSYPRHPHDDYESQTPEALEIDPATARSIPYEDWPDEWKNPSTRVGVDYVKSENPDVPLTADMFAGNEDLAGLPPMSQWTKFIPQALVHSEFERLQEAVTVITVFQDDYRKEFGEALHVVTAQVPRLIARYKELWDIASGIVNKEMLDDGS